MWCAISSKPIFLSSRTKKEMEKIEMISHGTHQLALRRMSVKVLEGATNTSIMRSGSDKAGCCGTSGTVATGIGGGGVLIAHPTNEIAKGYEFPVMAC